MDFRSSPIGVVEIIIATRYHCGLVWLENLNLRRAYKYGILKFINRNHPELSGLYNQIYIRKDRSWWRELDGRIAEFAKREGFKYVRNDDPDLSKEKALPMFVNYFHHKEILRS